MIRILLLALIITATPLLSDEGMWPLNMVPHKQIEDQAWLTEVQKACLRMSTGGSASFISPKGLLMTNHHVGGKAIYNLSGEQRDLMKEGFYADTYAKELKCPNLFVEQLVSIQDVTDEINKELPPAGKEKKRKEAIAHLCKRKQEETGLKPEVVTLYQGARFHLYLYKRYTDVRLVMAPEQEIAFFGGDAANFEYPRYCLDVAFFRVYENNEPLASCDYLKWSPEGPKLKEPLFVMGHPGHTERKLASHHLAFMRDQELPMILQLLEERLACLDEYAKQSAEHERQASQRIYSLRNVKKVFKATYAGLKNSSIIKNKETFEKEERLDTSQIQACLEQSKTFYYKYHILEGIGSHYSKLYSFAKILVRAQEELAKPAHLRLPEYTESELAALELDLFSTEPLYPALEKALLVDGLLRLEKRIGKEVFNGKSVEEFASYLIANTELQDVAVRKRLYTNPQEIQTSKDPLILFAKALDPYARELRERYENEVESVLKDSYTTITETLFEKYKEALYPDATFTLRLSIGQMAGYVEEGIEIPPTTQIEGAYLQGSTLPKSWSEKQHLVDKKVPFNFVSTNDIIGGNSGSPIINKNKEVVGIIFDGNRHAFMWNYEFNETQGRAISVHSQAILESLKTIYDAKPLVDEILRARSG